MTTSLFSFTDRARPIAQIGLGDRRIDGPEAARWDDAHWDDPGSLWAGTDPFWLDISCDAHEASTFYGRKRSTDRFMPGQLSLVAKNESGWADPTPPEGDPSMLSLRAGRPIRVGVEHGVLGVQWRWRGYVDAVRPRYDAEVGEVVDVSATCALGEAGRAEAAQLAVPVGGGELAGTRITRIANAGSWPAALRSIASTGVHVEETVLGGTVANLLGVTADSAGGAVFGDTEGRLVFKGRDWQIFNEGDLPDGTIGNLTTPDEDPPGSGLVLFDLELWDELLPDLYEYVGP